jgi:hypothetical protein
VALTGLADLKIVPGQAVMLAADAVSAEPVRVLQRTRPQTGHHRLGWIRQSLIRKKVAPMVHWAA